MYHHDTTQTLHIGAPLSDAQAAVILLHGRGSSGEEIAGLADTLASERIVFLAPSADGGQWYPQRFLVPLAQNEPGLSRALATVDELVRQAEAAGIPAERVGIAGFSQGACLALEYVARHPRRYGFVGGLSGALIGPLGVPRPSGDLKQTPVLLGCAERDAHIPLEHVEASAAALSTAGAKVTKMIFPGSAHTVFQEEIVWLRAHIESQLAAAR
jgi:phospholipase/carboxylesterase